MRIARAGAFRLPAQIQVLRTGTGEAKRPAAIVQALGEEPRSARRDPHRRLRRGDEEASPRPRSISSSPILPITCSSKARCRVPTRAWSTRSTTTGTSSPISPNTTPSRATGSTAVRRRDEARRDDRRHRLLPQHLPRRRDPAGSRLLDPQRHRLAQGQSDAELPRPPLHQRPRDDDLGGARRRTPRPTRSTTRR